MLKPHIYLKVFLIALIAALPIANALKNAKQKWNRASYVVEHYKKGYILEGNK